MVEATVIVPTHNHADTLFWSVGSVLRQTVRELEVFIIGDGADPPTREAAQDLARRHGRVCYFDFSKGKRHGEAHRHQVLTQEARGRIVCYQSDDDLWLDDHVEVLSRALQDADLAHTLPLDILPDQTVSAWIFNLNDRHDCEMMRQGRTGFGLARGAHTLQAYRRLPHGWRPAPKRIATDLHMWNQFIDQRWCRALSLTRPTALHFASRARQALSLQDRLHELRHWSDRLRRPDFKCELTLAALTAIHSHGNNLTLRWRVQELEQALGGNPLRYALQRVLGNPGWSFFLSKLYRRWTR